MEPSAKWWHLSPSLSVPYTRSPTSERSPNSDQPTRRFCDLAFLYRAVGVKLDKFAQKRSRVGYRVDDDDVQQILFDSEPDWELFERLLQEVPVVRHLVDPRRDIDTLAGEDVEIDS
ncbi:hypothetical protein JG688_00018030 [Phytophthora aleatoria]|uniref:Uncharacterized protein n=1 Tax=Phytophthora aleatoria TaxID=2496075 RepID=A0A8J5I2I7_9STRA|nr:hypothetical protein JG688_00018030 [Phytophthora aleatoria]